jgi:hypothetical protein
MNQANLIFIPNQKYNQYYCSNICRKIKSIKQPNKMYVLSFLDKQSCCHCHANTNRYQQKMFRELVDA